MLGILKTQLISYLTNRLVCPEKHLFSRVDNLPLNIFLRCLASLFLYQVTKIVGREKHPFSKIAYSRNAHSLRFITLKIVIKQGLKLRKHVQVGVRPCHELTIVETHAIIQKQLDVSCDQPLAQFVYRMQKFQLYFLQAVENDVALLFRQMQSFTRTIRKE